MILYKYRSLSNFEHVADIILNDRLYCPTYDRLNDPFEGLFFVLWMVSFRNKSLKKFAFPTKVKETLTKTRVCSLSSSISDVRLWSHYADGHKGIALAIDFTDIESQIHKVIYSTKLPQLDKPTPQEVFSHKTNHWKYEAEYRIIQDEKYFSISKRIKAIYIGYRIDNNHLDLLNKMVSNNIAIYSTKLNVGKVIVETDKQLNKFGFKSI